MKLSNVGLAAAVFSLVAFIALAAKHNGVLPPYMWLGEAVVVTVTLLPTIARHMRHQLVAWAGVVVVSLSAILLGAQKSRYLVPIVHAIALTPRAHVFLVVMGAVSLVWGMFGVLNALATEPGDRQ